MRKQRNIFLFISFLLFLFSLLPLSFSNAHQSGCHRWHSCPSDSGRYICGDIGNCSKCPDNQFCIDGKPRSKINNEAVQHNNNYIAIPPKYHLCPRVIDGDTIIVTIDGKEERVRLIGVDTPETKHPKKPVEYYGKEASAFTKRMTEGKKAHLEYDQQKRDKYNRLLAYVYLEDGTFLNAEIIKQGYGVAYTRFPFKYLDDFRQYEKEARESKKGLWGVRIINHPASP